MADSVEIIFVDENDFVKEGKWYFLSENSRWGTIRTSGKTDLHFRLQRPDSPSLSPDFLLHAYKGKRITIRLAIYEQDLYMGARRYEIFLRVFNYIEIEHEKIKPGSASGQDEVNPVF